MRFGRFSFGSIQIDGSTYEHDVIIDRGEIRKRKKKPSKKFREQFGLVPILKKQAGFVDETVLVSDAEPNQVLGLSLWNSKEDAERYPREQYQQIHDTLKHLLDGEPVIRTFDVQSSTTHQITACKAA